MPAVCTTLTSLNNDIAEAQRQIDRGNLSYKSILEFRKQRKENFLRGDYDNKLIAQGCKPLGQAIGLDPLPSFMTGLESQVTPRPNSTVIRTESGSSTPTYTSSQSTASQSAPKTNYAVQSSSFTPPQSMSYDDSDSGRSGGFRTVIILLAIGGGVFYLYKKGKLNGIIAKGKELVGKLKKKK